MSGRPPKRRLPPFSVRLNEHERSILVARAGDLSLSAYVKSVLFAEDAPSYRKASRTIPIERQTLGRVLAGLGASRLASNLNQLAKAANQGALPVSEELEADLKRACAEIAEMRGLLLRALGLQTIEQTTGEPPLSDAFRQSAGARA